MPGAGSRRSFVLRKDSPGSRRGQGRHSTLRKGAGLTSRKLFLIDSSALAYRSFYAFINNPLTTAQGEPTSAVFGYVSQILRLLQAESPTHLAVVQDLQEPTFRHKMYPEYKATRKPMPDDLRLQWPIIDEFVDLSRLPRVSKAGYEADDVMATLAAEAETKGFQVFLFTKDKDMMQVVNRNIQLYEPGQRDGPPTHKGPDEVEKKFGVPPEHIVDLLALMGDSADNIPGVPKVGPKTAADLLKTYGSLDNIYKNVDNITKKALRKNLAENKDKAFLSRDLVLLNKKVPLDKTLSDLKREPLDTGALEIFLKRWELNSLLGHLPKDGQKKGGPSKPAKKARYRLVTQKNLEAFRNDLEKAKVIAYDTETTSLDSLEADLVGLCFSTEPGTGWYLPMGHKEGNNLKLPEAQKLLGKILKDSEKQFVFHNAKYDLPILERHGLAPDNPSRGKDPRVLDTLIGFHLLNPGFRGLSLDDLALKHFNHEMIPIESLIGKKGKDQKSFAEAPVEEACEYGAEDADITLRLWLYLEPELLKNKLDAPYYQLELPLLPVLTRMEQRGIRLDAPKLEKLNREAEKEIASLEKKIYQEAGEEFNIGSTQQLSAVLFEKLKLKSGKKTKTGYSTDAAVLNKLLGSHPVIEHLLQYRELVKLKNTYIDVLPKLIKKRTGRIHTSYSQTIAATGRLSSISPNLQNIPIRTEHGRKIRDCFVARSPKYCLVSADYSQVELRVLAHLTEDPGLVEAYRENRDIHARTAAALYKVKESEVTSDMRRNAKVVNFGVLYGMGPGRLSGDLGISRQEASDFIENYFNRYKKVKQFIQDTVDTARKQGYVETLSGRRRYFPDLAADNRMLIEKAEREAVNTPIQGSAADLIKHAMIKIDAERNSSRLDCDMLLQVHDELVFEVANKDREASSKRIRQLMESALPLKVPLVVDIGYGQTWLEAHG